MLSSAGFIHIMYYYHYYFIISNYYKTLCEKCTFKNHHQFWYWLIGASFKNKQIFQKQRITVPRQIKVV